ncbi:MAG: phasin family protein [Motiliproteus sp.]|jgi:phasin family protein
MYQDIVENMKTQMKPVMDLVETNKVTLEALAALQKSSLHEVMKTSMDQLQALAECKDPQVAMELQAKFYQELGAKMSSTTEQSIAAMTTAKDAFSAAIEVAATKAVVENEIETGTDLEKTASAK